MVEIFLAHAEAGSCHKKDRLHRVSPIMIGVSQCRNEKLANLFYRLKLIEAYGTGISKIISSYNDSIKKPIINATYGAFQVVLPNLNFMHNEMVNKELIITAGKGKRTMYIR